MTTKASVCGRYYEESHSGWTSAPEMYGTYSILDANGWALATLHYDYRFTSNATNLRRARLISAAPDLLEACIEFVRKVDAGEARSTKSYEQMKAAIAKATA